MREQAPEQALEQAAGPDAQQKERKFVQPVTLEVSEGPMVEEIPAATDIPELDDVYTQILLSVMRGEPVAGLIRQKALMPSVVADAINEALFDEIGDNVLSCEGDEIMLVEDYREDLERILE